MSRLAALLLVAALVATCGATRGNRGGPAWSSPGLVGGGGWPFAGEPLAPADADGAAYLPDSSVVRLADGRVRLVPFGGETPVTVRGDDPRVAAAVRSDQRWLARGSIPGEHIPVPPEPSPRPHAQATNPARPPVVAPQQKPVVNVPQPGPYRDMAARALLDLRLLTRPNGASLASWYGAWRYSWPRDSAFASAAFAVCGHRKEAKRILRFMAGVQSADGKWAARYHPDGTAVTDGRHPQLDSLGWVLWAAWFFRTQDPQAADAMPEMWPMVQRAADQLTRSLGRNGLPPPSSDYWERPPGSEQDPDRATLGVVGPVLAGLRSATVYARETGHADRAARWQAAVNRLSGAVARDFAPHGYPRSPVRGGRMDTSVTFLSPPFAAVDPAVGAAVTRAAAKQALPNGGVLPGEVWSGNKKIAWTPEMALFALSAGASGRLDEARSRLDWLSRHRTSLGVLPEKVDENGKPAAVAPLGWTASLVLLTLASMEKPLPVPLP